MTESSIDIEIQWFQRPGDPPAVTAVVFDAKGKAAHRTYPSIGDMEQAVQQDQEKRYPDKLVNIRFEKRPPDEFFQT